jgi:hypothetical protein
MGLEIGNGFQGGDVTTGFTLTDGSGTTANGSAVDLGGEITQNTEVYFNTPDSTHMGATFLPNGDVSLPAPTLVFGERTNDGNVNGIGVVNIPSTLYFTQIGYTGRAIGEFTYRPNTGESSIEFEVTRDSDGYIAALKLTPDQLTYGGYVSGDYYLNLDVISKVYEIGNLNGGTKISINDLTQIVNISNVPTYANDAAATTGGLTTGDVYKNTTGGVTHLCIVP